jgi:hypothetical protein
VVVVVIAVAVAVAIAQATDYPLRNGYKEKIININKDNKHPLNRASSSFDFQMTVASALWMYIVLFFVILLTQLTMIL